MSRVTSIGGKRTFTLEEARELLPVVRRVTKTAHAEIELLGGQLNHVQDPEKRQALEERIRSELGEWQEKIVRLGCEAKGLWLVDFDSGEGYYCWHYPETDVQFFHGYDQGFQGRTPLS